MKTRWLRLAALTAVLFTALGSAVAVAETVASRDFNDETWSEGLIDLRPLDLSRTNLVGNGFAPGLRVT